jgi:hypothetical protein
MSMDLSTAIEEEIVEPAARELRSVGVVSTQYATLFEPPHEMTLVAGAKLGPVRVAYETYGELSAARDNAIFVGADRIANAEQPGRPVMEVNYETYAEGEALLGWLNATVQLSCREPFDGNAVLDQLARDIQEQLSESKAEIAHFKMTLDPENSFGDLGIINLVRNDYVPELSQTLPDPLESGQLIINLRAEVAPEILRDAVTKGLERCGTKNPGLTLDLEHLEHFRPGKPVPTHRLSTMT